MHRYYIALVTMRIVHVTRLLSGHMPRAIIVPRQAVSDGKGPSVVTALNRLNQTELSSLISCVDSNEMPVY